MLQQCVRCSVRGVADEAATQGRYMPVLTGERGVNKVTLIGRLGRDPEVRGSADNPVTVFSLATSQTFKTPDDTYQQQTEWHRVIIFRRVMAQLIANTVRKGDRVFVSGSLNYNKLVNKETQQTTSIAQIKADDVILLEKKYHENEDEEGKEE